MAKVVNMGEASPSLLAWLLQFLEAPDAPEASEPQASEDPQELMDSQLAEIEISLSE